MSRVTESVAMLVQTNFPAVLVPSYQGFDVFISEVIHDGPHHDVGIRRRMPLGTGRRRGVGAKLHLAAQD